MNHKITLTLSGLFLVVLGIICIANPLEFLESIAWIIGITILLAGVLRLVFALRAKRYAGIRPTRYLSSAVLILAGIAILASPLFSVQFFTLIASVYLLIEGIIIAVQSVYYRRAGFRFWYLILILGIAIAALGCIGTGNPSALASAVGIYMGIAMIFNGIAYFIALAGLSQLEHFDHAEEVQ